MKNFLNVAYDINKKKISYNYPSALIKYLIERFNIKENSKVFEPGPGRGEFLQQFHNHKMQTFGMDYCSFTGERDFEFKSEIKIHDAENIPYPYPENYFDIIYSKSFIEHFYYTDRVMGELYRILKPGGIIITLTPNWTYMYKVFYDSCTHRTAFTKKSIKDLHEISGFRNLESENFKQIPLLWGNNILLKFFSELTRLFLPDRFLVKNKWIRFSKEIMIICVGRK